VRFLTPPASAAIQRLRGTTVVDRTRAAGPRPAWITSTTDGIDHAITASAVDVAGLDDLPRAACGATVLPIPLVCPPGPPCGRCLANLQRPAPRRRGRRLARWVRGLRRGGRHGAEARGMVVAR